MTKKEKTPQKIAKTIAKKINTLSEEAREHTTIYAVIGDMEREENYSVVSSNEDDLIMTIAQDLYGNEHHRRIVQKAVMIANKAITEECEEFAKSIIKF